MGYNLGLCLEATYNHKSLIKMADKNQGLISYYTLCAALIRTLFDLMHLIFCHTLCILYGISLFTCLSCCCHFIVILLNICCIFSKQSISVLVLSAVYSFLLQQANFLTGIVKVRSYLIKFLFICCGKCESFVKAQSCATTNSQKLEADFNAACHL